jgi:valyl-tRNA synthetase
MVVAPAVDAVTVPLDQAMLARLGSVVDEATAAFEGYDYARALERTEAFFWSFCDDYLELVKTRAYGEPGEGATASARAALATALSVLLRLLAPVLPFVTEEVWSWWQAGSIHTAPWPARSELGPAGSAGVGDGDRVLEVAAGVLGRVRQAKSQAKRSMRSKVATLTVTDTPERIAALLLARDDVADAGGVEDLVTVEGDEPSIEVVLADEE